MLKVYGVTLRTPAIITRHGRQNKKTYRLNKY